MVEQLVLAEEEALVPALQQLVGLPAGDQASSPTSRLATQSVSKAAGWPTSFFKSSQNGVELALFDQPAPPQQIDIRIRRWLSHTCPASRC